jgi:hypothetical protein
LLADVCGRIATFLMEQVITTGGKFHADETLWANIVFGDYEIFAFLLVHEFLHSSLSTNFCDIVAFLLGRCISSLYEMMMRILSYDACELWISVNLDVRSNFCEFSHILSGSRMQPPMAAKSWLDPGCNWKAGSRLL